MTICYAKYFNESAMPLASNVRKIKIKNVCIFMEFCERLPSIIAKMATSWTETDNKERFKTEKNNGFNSSIR